MRSDAVVLVEFSPSGGLFQYALALGEALAGRGLRTELWTGPDPEIASSTGNFVVRSVLPTWHPAAPARLSRWPAPIRRAQRASLLVAAWVVLAVRLYRASPRVVLFSQWRFAFEPLFVLAIRAVLPRTTIGILAHEPLPRSDAKDTSTPKTGRLLHAAFGAAWRRLDVAFVLGPATRDLVLAHWRPRCEVVVVPHGDAHAVRRAAPTPDGPADGAAPVALFFGTWSTYKGIDVLLEAFALVRSELPAARLVLAGPVGADVDAGELLARAGSIGHVDARPGYLPLAAVPALVTGARLVVTPYLRASQSGVAHLAFTFGRPVVGTTVGDLPSAIADGATGLLVPPSDPRALAAAMLKLLLDADLAAEMGEAGRRSVAAAWDVAARRIAEALETADRRNPPCT